MVNLAFGINGELYSIQRKTDSAWVVFNVDIEGKFSNPIVFKISESASIEDIINKAISYHWEV
jgi:hypothetical protein